VVRGRVQGVGFAGLWSARRTSSHRWLVRNNAVWQCRVLAQGTRDQLLGLRSRLREGAARLAWMPSRNPKLSRSPLSVHFA